MSAFTPSFCPHAACHGRTAFSFQRKGMYWRKCDNRFVQRFQCKSCGHTFSTQTFRFDWRHHLPLVTLDIFRGFVAKTTQRHMARSMDLNRKTIARRLDQLGKHCEAFHRARLPLLRDQPEPWEFVFDELETFEQNRLHKPLTVPAMVHRSSMYVVDLQVGRLASRRKKEALAKGYERRISESRLVCQSVMFRFGRLLQGKEGMHVHTDRKQGYRKWLKTFCPLLAGHHRTSSKRKRDTSNPLARVNLTFAMMRDGLSRLVRRNWAHSKKGEKLHLHLWIWVTWRNYVRQITNMDPWNTPATVLGIEPRRLQLHEVLQRRVFGAWCTSPGWGAFASRT